VSELVKQEEAARTIINLMKQVGGKIQKRVRLDTPDHGLTFTQLFVLASLNRHGQMKMSDLSERLGLTNSTTSGIVDRLVKMGLVCRNRSEQDRRVVYVALTDVSQRFAGGIEARIDQLVLELFGSASEADLQCIIQGLKRLDAIIDDVQTQTRDQRGE
jgi:DNA-binding MarR family transcriptional regulator